MNRVRASGRTARRVARVEDRLRRGEPARRRAHGPFPSGRLRDGWPSARLHRAVGPASSRLLGTREPMSATTTPRAQVPVRARTLRPSPFHLPVSAPAVVTPPVVGREPAEPETDITAVDVAAPAVAVSAAVAAPLVLEPPAPVLTPPVVEVEVEPEPAEAVVEAVVEAEAAVEPDPVAVETAPVVVEPAPTAVESEAALEAPPSPPVDVPWAALTPTDNTFTSAPSPPSPPPARTSRRTRVLVGAAVLVLAAGGTVGGVVASRSGSSDGGTTTAAVAAASADDLAAWLRANVASGTPVVTTDPALATALGRRGLDVRTVPDLASAPAAGVVVAAADTAEPVPTAVSAERAQVPLAQFGSGSDAYGIGQLVDRPVATVVADLAAQQGTARAATAGLLGNAAVDIRADARPAFTAGTIDLRAAAFLALLAGSQQVGVVSAPQDAAEAATRLPVRSLVVAVGDPDGLRALVDSARYPYAPTVDTATSDPSVPGDSVLLVWPVIADPARTVN